MRNKYSYLTKNVILFTISGFVPKILSFLLVPIYTSHLTTLEYGVADLISTTVLLLLPVFTLDIQDAVVRFALDNKYENEDVFSTALKIILAGAIIVFAGTWVVSMLDVSAIDNICLLFFCLMYFTTAVQNSVTLFCRGINKVDVITISSILNSIITLGANILFLVCFKWGLKGYLTANIIGVTVALIYCFFAAKLYKYIKWDTSKSVRRDMVKFTFPLIFSVIAWWVNSASDRYILSWMSGVAVSGIYAVSYKIPNLLSMFQNIFTQAWSISAVKEFDKDDSDGFIGTMYTMMNFSMTIICSGIMVLNIPIAKILYADEFFAAWEYVPPLLISVVFNAMALFIGSIFTAVKDTKTLSISTIVGAIVNTICNFIFISFWGVYGAAIATMIGYAVVLVMRHVVLRKHIVMNIKWVRDITTYALLIAQMYISRYGIDGIGYQVIVLLVMLFLYIDEIKKIQGKLAMPLSQLFDFCSK